MWLTRFFPKTIARLSSPYNADIRVVEERGVLKVLVNGSRQSGEYIKMLWDTAFDAFDVGEHKAVSSILVLGVGGGTVIHLLSHLFPEANITAVDIDPTMIDVGRRYFKLDAIPHLTLVEADARAYVVSQAKRPPRYDLIVVDLFVGRDIPEFVSDISFLQDCKRLLSKRGSIVINYLRELSYGEKSNEVKSKLEQLFSTVQEIVLYRNRFFFSE